MMLPPPRFHSERLVYRSLDVDKDKDFISKVLADPVVMLNADPAIPQPFNESMVDGSIKYFKDAWMFVMACLKDPASSSSNEATPKAGPPIGWVILTQQGGVRMAHHKIISFGIQMHCDYRGQGYGTELLGWAIDHAFRHSNIHRIQGGYFAWNEAARKSYKKLGFVEEGIGRKVFWQDGDWRDEIHLGLLYEDWLASSYYKKVIESA